jgi:hypothetical protein
VYISSHSARQHPSNSERSLYVIQYKSNMHTHREIGVYPVVSVNGGAKSKHWQYVRKLGPGPPPYATPADPARGVPVRNIYSEEIRCGRQAFASATTTETLIVNTGDEITFFTYANQKRLRSLKQRYTCSCISRPPYLNSLEEYQLFTLLCTLFPSTYRTLYCLLRIMLNRYRQLL